jgi:hypothetical protein
MKLEHAHADQLDVKLQNPLFGFKCLHYSVTESAGHVEITIIKKMMNHELSVGVRTIDFLIEGLVVFWSNSGIINGPDANAKLVIHHLFNNCNFYVTCTFCNRVMQAFETKKWVL